MIAKKVYESVSFQRGVDPKHSMGIGQVQTLVDKWNNLQSMTGIGSMGLIKKLGVGWYLKMGISRMPGSALGVFSSVKKVFGTDYFVWHDNFTKQPFAHFRIKPEHESLFISVYNQIYPDWPFVNETVQFRRGEDPKSSMGIGLREKYGEMYDLFIRCHNIAKSSDDFEYVSEISIDEEYPYFNIESKSYYWTDWDGTPIPEQLVIKLYPDELEYYNVGTRNIQGFKSVNGFIELVIPHSSDTVSYKIHENTYFKRTGVPKDDMRIGLDALGLKIDSIYQKEDPDWEINRSDLLKVSEEEAHQVLKDMSHWKYRNYLLYIGEDIMGDTDKGVRLIEYAKSYYSIGYARSKAFTYDYIIYQGVPYKIKKTDEG